MFDLYRFMKCVHLKWITPIALQVVLNVQSCTLFVFMCMTLRPRFTFILESSHVIKAKITNMADESGTIFN